MGWVMEHAFAQRLSFRKVGEAAKNYVELPLVDQVDALLSEIDGGAVECVTLYGPQDQKLFVLGKPGAYLLTLFVDEGDGYAFNDGSGDRSRIDIGGDFWPAFRVCKDRRILEDAVHRFYEAGKLPDSPNWVYFTDE
jgi:hypothetical protein